MYLSCLVYYQSCVPSLILTTHILTYGRHDVHRRSPDSEDHRGENVTIAAARKSRHVTQKELAEATGIDQSDISKIETGNANPALSTLIRLAEGMDMALQLEFIPKQLR